MVHVQQVTLVKKDTGTEKYKLGHIIVILHVVWDVRAASVMMQLEYAKNNRAYQDIAGSNVKSNASPQAAPIAKEN